MNSWSEIRNVEFASDLPPVKIESWTKQTNVHQSRHFCIPASRESLQIGGGNAPMKLFLYPLPAPTICNAGMLLFRASNAASVCLGLRELWQASRW